MLKSAKIVKRIAAIFCVVTLCVVGGIYAKETNLKDRIWLSKYVSIENAIKQEGIFVINNAKGVSIWNTDYQNTVTNKIHAALKKNKYTIKKPLLLINPYGTNTCSVNVYFEAEEGATFMYQVATKGYEIFEQTVYTEKSQRQYEAQLIGLIPGEENKLTLRLIKNGEVIGQSEHTIMMPEAASTLTKQMEIEEGKSTKELTDGLYAVIGHNKSFDANVYLYDNHGVIRGEIPVKKYRSDRLLFIDGYLFYSYDFNKIAKMNRKGQIEETYRFHKDYELHHDFIYDENNHRILMLATNKTEETLEDLILSLDLNTGETKELIEMKTVMPEAHEAAIQPSYKKKLDWIHINSLQLTKEGDILLSSRETSSILCVTDIDTNPALSYIISDSSMWEGTVYEEKVLAKDGDFIAQAGQHTIAYMQEESERLEDGQYYLSMFNNNFGYSGSRPKIKWTNYEGVGNYKKVATASKYYRYLVDTNKGTFTLVKEFDVPYSPYVSSAQNYQEHFVAGSGAIAKVEELNVDEGYEAKNDQSNENYRSCFGEYDENGVLIRRFKFYDKKYLYRTYKYDFYQFYFIK